MFVSDQPLHQRLTYRRGRNRGAGTTLDLERLHGQRWLSVGGRQPCPTAIVLAPSMAMPATNANRAFLMIASRLSRTSSCGRCYADVRVRDHATYLNAKNNVSL